MGRRIVANRWTPSEAINAFCGWLTVQETPVILGAQNEVGPVIEAIQKFCNAYGFPAPRGGWEKAVKPIDD